MLFIQRLCVNKKIVKYYFCYVIIITWKKIILENPFGIFHIIGIMEQNDVNLLMILLYLLFAYNMISIHESISTSNKKA